MEDKFEVEWRASRLFVNRGDLGLRGLFGLLLKRRARGLVDRTGDLIEDSSVDIGESGEKEPRSGVMVSGVTVFILNFSSSGICRRSQTTLFPRKVRCWIKSRSKDGLESRLTKDALDVLPSMSMIGKT